MRMATICMDFGQVLGRDPDRLNSTREQTEKYEV